MQRLNFAHVLIFSVGLVFIVAESRAGIIPNGDFETGDLTGFHPLTPGLANGGTGNVLVQFLDGSHRAVINATAGPSTPSLSAGNAYMNSDLPFTVNVASLFEFDASYSYSTTATDSDAIRANLGLVGITASPVNSFLQYPISFVISGPGTGSIPDTSFSLPVPPGSYSIATDVHAFNGTNPTGSSSITLVVDNFRIVPVPEPSTIALAISGLACLAWRYRRRISQH